MKSRNLIMLWVITLNLVALALNNVNVSAVSSQQLPFDVAISVRVGDSVSNGSVVSYGLFNVYLKLKNDSDYFGYYQELFKKNSTLAKKEFYQLINSSVYTPLLNELSLKFKRFNITPTFYMPQGGNPIYLGANWSAVISFLVVPFFAPNGTFLSCPVSGELYLNISDKKVPLRWTKLVVDISDNYTVLSLYPKPALGRANTFEWVNGTYFPHITVYNTQYAFWYFINSTHKIIFLTFDSDTGYVQFNATFVGVKPIPPVVSLLVDSFRKRMNIVGISSFVQSNKLIIVGVAQPSGSYIEKHGKREWIIELPLPGRFDEIHVVGGSYQVLPDGTIIITISKEKRDYRDFLGIGLLVLVVIIGAVWLKRRKTANRVISEDDSSESNELYPNESQESEESNSVDSLKDGDGDEP